MTRTGARYFRDCDPEDRSRERWSWPLSADHKKEGEAVHIVPEGTPGATVVAVRRVNELDFYSLGLRDLAKKLGVGPTRLLWLIKKEGLQKNADFFKEIKIGKSSHKRYSGKVASVTRFFREK